MGESSATTPCEQRQATTTDVINKYCTLSIHSTNVIVANLKPLKWTPSTIATLVARYIP